jgi:hypothetical protein
MAKNENKRDVCSSFILKKGVLILSLPWQVSFPASPPAHKKYGSQLENK